MSPGDIASLTSIIFSILSLKKLMKIGFNLDGRSEMSRAQMSCMLKNEYQILSVSQNMIKIVFQSFGHNDFYSSAKYQTKMKMVLFRRKPIVRVFCQCNLRNVKKCTCRYNTILPNQCCAYNPLCICILLSDLRFDQSKYILNIRR